MKKAKRVKLNRFLRQKTGRKIIIRRIIEKRFGKVLRNEIRRILKSKVVVDLEKSQFKPILSVKVYPTKVTKQALKFPKAVMEMDIKDLTKLLKMKARSKK